MSTALPIVESMTISSELLARVAAGEEILIEKEGQPVAKLVRCDPPASKKPRTGGQWAGRVWISENFDDPLDPEMQAAFDGLRP